MVGEFAECTLQEPQPKDGGIFEGTACKGASVGFDVGKQLEPLTGKSVSLPECELKGGKGKGTGIAVMLRWTLRRKATPQTT